MENEKPTLKQLEDAYRIVQFLLVASSIYTTDSYLLLKATRQEGDGKITFSLISSSIDVEQLQHMKELVPKPPEYVG